MTRSTAHIKGSKIGVHTIPRDRFKEEGRDTEEEIDRFTSAPETSVDHLLARVEQMYTMLDSHMQHTADQFAYVQGQITALSSQIDDLSVDRGSDLEFDQF